ncbi:MAG: heparinase II/III family protein [Fibrobacterota bacterium]
MNGQSLPTDSAFFASMNLDYAGLDSVKTYVSGNDYENAKRAYVDFMIHRTDRKYFYNYFQKDSTMVLLRTTYPDLDARAAGVIASADLTLTNTFCVNGICVTFPGPIDWQSIPPGGSVEYPVQLNRNGEWPVLGQAYWLTGDAAYRAKFWALASEWISANSVISSSPNSWRSLDAGIRMRTWIQALGYFSGAVEISYQDYFNIYKSIMQHGYFLAPFELSARAGNWQVTECAGLLNLGLLFPEWLDSPTWKNLAIARLTEQINAGLLADGYYNELTPGYHTGCVKQFIDCEMLCRFNGVAGFSAASLGKVEKGYQLFLNIDMPNGLPPAVGDHFFASDEKQLFKYNPIRISSSAPVGPPATAFFGNEVFKDVLCDQDFGWLNLLMYGKATYDSFMDLTSRDTVLVSNYLPNSRFFTMRSGKGYHDTASLYGHFDMASGGYHSHYDALNIILAGYGRQLLIDPGLGSDYNTIWTSYYTQQRAHNAIIMDGTARNGTSDKVAYHDKHAIHNLFDYAKGHYDGTGTPFRHYRELMFIKGEYWLLRDKITGSSTSRRAEQLFHFFPSTPVTTANSIFTDYGDTLPNLIITPVEKESLSLSVDQSGWLYCLDKKEISGYTHEKAPIAAYSKQKTLPITFENVLFPLPAGASESVTATYIPAVCGNLDKNVNTGAEVALSQDKKDLVGWSDNGQAVLFANGIQLNGEVGLVRTRADTVYAFALVGTSVLYKNSVGIKATGEISGFLSNKTGEVTLSSAQTVTFYYPGLQGVSVDGTPVTPQSQGTGWMGIPMLSGTHTIEIIASGRPAGLKDTLGTVTPVLYEVSSVEVNLVDIAWHPGTANLAEIAGYLVYRNDSLVAATTDTVFADYTVDFALVPEYRYKISAVNGYGKEGNPSNELTALPPLDTLSLALVSVQNLGNDKVLLLFNKMLDSLSASTTANYGISGLTVSQALLFANPTMVLLTVSPMTDGALYELQAGNINDRSVPPHTLPNGTIQQFICSDKNIGLTGWWPFDENRGDIAYDWSGGNNHGSQNSGCSRVSGKLDNAVHVDSISSGSVTMAGSPRTLDFPFSFSAWVKVNGATQSQALIVTEDVSGRYYGSWMGLSAGGKVSAGFGNGGTPSASSRKDYSSNGVISTNQWNHVAAVFNSATDVKVYINGVDNGTTSSGSATTLAHSTSGVLKLGERVAAVTPVVHLLGDLDEVRIYHVALTPAQITALSQDTALPTGREILSETGRALTLRVSPNPFNPSTVIEYSIPIKGHVTLNIYNVTGSRMVQLAKGEREAGQYRVALTGTGLASGLYLLRLQAGSNVLERKMVYLK